jgi:Rieske Fe-S protein
MENEKNDRLRRRDFVQLTLGWGAALFAFAASAAAGAKFMIPNVLYEADRRFRVLKPEDYPEGTTFLSEARVYLLRKGNAFRAVSAVCPHLGCTVNRAGEGKGFHCPCHGSFFDESGKVTGGPSPRALAWYAVTLSRDGRLVIDTSLEVAADKYLVI